MGALHTSRRGLLGALAITPMAAGAVLAAPKASKAVTSAEWRRILANYRASDKAFGAFCRDRFDPAHSAWRERESARKASLQQQIDALPHYETTAKYETMENGWRSMSTRKPVDVAMAASFTLKPSSAPCDFDTCCAELHAASQRRETAAQGLRDAMPPEVFDPALEQENKRWEDVNGAAYSAVVDFEPSTLADLTAQIAFFEQEDREVDPTELLASLARLRKGELA